MARKRWLASLFAPARRPVRKSSRRRPVLEILEDRTLPATTSVLSLASGGTSLSTANGQSEITPTHSISDDGRYTVFCSTGTNLVANQKAGATYTVIDVYLYDRNSGSVTLVSHASGTPATGANGDSFNPVISGDGSTVVFYSCATNLGAKTAGGKSASVPTNFTVVELYRYDVASGNLYLVSHKSSDATTGANGSNPGIPTNAGESNGFYNTLGYSTGSAALGYDIMGLALPSVSTDGRYIAYISDATNLAATDTSNGDTDLFGDPIYYTNVYLYDGNSADSGYDTNTLVSHADGATSTCAGGFASTVAISGDGTTVAFTDPAPDLTSSTSSTLGANDQLYVWSRIDNTATTGLTSGQTVLASCSSSDSTAGADIPSNLDGSTGLGALLGFTGWTADTSPSLSSNGRYIAYYDAGDNLVAKQGGTASVLNVFRYDTLGQTNELVSHVANDTATAGDNPQNKIADPDLGPVEATGPAISSDGRYIAFANNSSNLLSTTSPFTTNGGAYDGRDNVYLYDADNPDVLTLVSHASGSTTTPDTNGGTAPSMSADGRYIAFLDWALPTTSKPSAAAAEVRLFDSQASDRTVQPIDLGGAFDSGTTSATIESAVLAPTVMSADTPSSDNRPVIGWDGLASKVVSTVSDSNSNIDVFESVDAGTPPTFPGPSSIITFTVGTTGTYTLPGSGNPTPTYSITNGTLPGGLTFDGKGGTISGTPTTGGSTTLVITATNPAGSATLTLTIIVNQTPSIPTQTLPTFTVGTSGSYTFQTQGYPPPTITYTGSIPTGMTLSSGGTLSGTPTSGGQYTFTITATNSQGSASQSFTATVNQTPSIPTQTIPTFTAGTFGSYTIQTQGYPPPTITYTGSIPDGMTLSSGGTLSGTPTTGGQYTFTVTASNSSGSTQQTFTATVNQSPSFPAPTIPPFTAGGSNSFTFTAGGWPVPTFTSSDLPTGLTLTSGGKLTGTPSAGGGVFTFTVTARNGILPDVSQKVSLTVNQAPLILTTSAVCTVGVFQSVTVATSGFPSPTVSVANGSSLPSWLSLNGGVLSGNPTTSGISTFSLTATNVAGSDTELFTVKVIQAPAFTSNDQATFVAGAVNTFTVAASGFPAPTIGSTDLPAGLSLVAGADPGTAVLSGTPNAGGGVYSFHFSASNGVAPDASQAFTLKVLQSPAFTSDDHTSFIAGATNSFTVSALGYPAPTFNSANLPAGLSLAPGAVPGTAILSGTPDAGGGVYTFTIAATNGVAPDASQTFTLKVNVAPTITSTDQATFIAGTVNSFTVTAEGLPAPSIASADLPAGLSLVDGAAPGTAILSGTPNAGGGVYTFHFSATNGALPDAVQTFTLKVLASPSFTSDDHATFVAGATNRFTVSALGYPAPTFSSNDLPAGLSLSAGAVPGTATLSGSPDAGGGVYTFSITATNGVAPDVVQHFTLKVNVAPTITSADHTTFIARGTNAFTVTATGLPAAGITSSDLPAGLSLVAGSDPGTAILNGTPTAGGGIYTFDLTASNGVAPDATQSFTLKVLQSPVFTSTDNAVFVAGSPANAFVVATAGYPAAAISSPDLPAGLSLDAGTVSGTAVLSGTPTGGAGTYHFHLVATNGVLPDADEAFTLVVNTAPVIVTTSATFREGIANTATVSVLGSPSPILTVASGSSLPSWLSLAGNQLAGTPPAGSGGVYTFDLTATNSVGQASGMFTLTVAESPAFASADHSFFIAGGVNSFTVTATGHPAPVITSPDLPSGLSLAPGAVAGTAVLSGTPDAGGGIYSFHLVASNGIDPDAIQAFALAVSLAPSFTSPDHATFTVAGPNSFTVSAAGVPSPIIAADLPIGLNLAVDPTTGTATLTGSPVTGPGIYPIDFTATNAAGIAHQSFTLIVSQAPSFTSLDHATFTAGAANSFTVTAIGLPTPAVNSSDVPDGMHLDAGSDPGTVVLSGTPTTGGGVYTIHFVATNGAWPDATQTFTLKVLQAPTITSADTTTFVMNQTGAVPGSNSFTVTTAGYPAPAFSSPDLPTGLNLQPGAVPATATVSGLPTAGGGVYSFHIVASNGVSPDASQLFTLTVEQAPRILTTSAMFGANHFNSVIVQVQGLPTPTLTVATGSSLPSWLTLSGSVLSGTPTTGGVYTFSLTASNSFGSDTELFTLTVLKSPTITSPSSTTFGTASGGASSAATAQTVALASPTPATATAGNIFNFTATGYPVPIFTSNDLPAGLGLTADGTLSGVPTAGVGTYGFHVTAQNGSQPNATQAFSLKVVRSPAFTSPNTATFTSGLANLFQFAASSTAPVTFSSSDLPVGLTLSRTGALSSLPTVGVGRYIFNVIATSAGVPATLQTFTLNVVANPLSGPIHYYAASPTEGTATTGQKSIIRHVRLTFAQPVYLDAGAISVLWLRGPGLYRANTAVSFTVAGNGTNTITLSFTGAMTQYNSLVDGVYQLRVLANKVHLGSRTGQTLAADLTETFDRLYGDMNGDGKIDAIDQAAFQLAYTAPATHAAYVTVLSLTGAARLGTLEYRQFYQRYGKHL